MVQLPEHLLWPAAKITPSPKPGQSTSGFGGTPDLPVGFSWPEHAGAPLSLLFRLDLADLKGVSHYLPLPEAGALLFFYDAINHPWGLEPCDVGSAKVVFLPAGASFVAHSTPVGAPDFPRVAARIEPMVSAPDPWSPWLDDLTLSADERYELADELAPYANHDTQIGGHPTVLQSPMELDCELLSRGYAHGPGIYQSSAAAEATPHARDWRMLLQIGSDDAIGMDWGLSGILYFWAKVDAIKELDFSEVVAIVQCT
ncbi:YwqG family protein [Caulobacter sp. 17J65-9]|uniref:YwqG family protein n=1 Tax=Caulobacter sp. 17J65-9 TaxID=2709382 RepID=UPI0013C97AAB|nr:YwqG family protein [Caulobacter sp. 17J65-9]NEX94152.1 DUF1963 domain-containing protein [Caulobacter sp. 17J65-9]